jgi:cytidylate kinase
VPHPAPRPQPVAGAEPVSGSSIVVAVDGPSGSGKSTVARAVASRLGLRYLDTGAMYRAVTWAVLDSEVDTADRAAVAAVADAITLGIGTDPDHPTVTVDDIDVSAAIREQGVTREVSAVAAVPAVRAAMVELQQRLIGLGGIVVEGRDIATVVAPDAAVKIYLTADPVARAQRRAAEEDTDHVQTEAELARRDALDSTRTASPLTRAPDATLIDATDLTAEEVVAMVLDLVTAADTQSEEGA